MIHTLDWKKFTLLPQPTIGYFVNACSTDSYGASQTFQTSSTDSNEKCTYLDRHNLDCQGEALVSFQLIDDGNQKQNYEYTCECEYKSHMSFIINAFDQSKSTRGLDSSRSPNEYLSQFRVVNDDNTNPATYFQPELDVHYVLLIKYKM